MRPPAPRAAASSRGASSIDPATEQLRRVLYGEDSPPNVPKLLGWGFLSLLPDRPAQGEFKKLLKEVETWTMTGTGAPPRAMTLVDAQQPFEPRIFLRGNPNRLGEPVPRRFLTLLDPQQQPFKSGSGRLELARSIVDRDNPLTSRVIVNRIWLQHFGTGLVATPSDFGLRSAPPTHPALLDYLAADFMQHGWSIKRLHRQIMLSAAYRQQSADRPDCRQVDPENLLLWRMNRQRLDFEAMRDALLAVAGTHDAKLYGPPENVLTGYNPRRTLYGFVDRMDLPGLLRAFDFPSPAATSPQRTSTTVPPQALFLDEQQLRHGIRPPSIARNRPSHRRRRVANDTTPRLTHIHQLLYGRQPTRVKRYPRKNSPSVRNTCAEIGELSPQNPTPSNTWLQYIHGLLRDDKRIRLHRFAM